MYNNMNEHISQFIKKQTCAGICCVNTKGYPYCFSSFYAFNDEDGMLYFKSSADTNHINYLKVNPEIAGTILPDKLQTLVVKGIQFRGILLAQQDALANHAAKYYYSKYPFALAIPGEVWTIKIHTIKMTDSSIGFGKKIIWDREEVLV